MVGRFGHLPGPSGQTLRNGKQREILQEEPFLIFSIKLLI
jgi:hypothetical protein